MERVVDRDYKFILVLKRASALPVPGVPSEEPERGLLRQEPLQWAGQLATGGWLGVSRCSQASCNTHAEQRLDLGESDAGLGRPSLLQGPSTIPG